MVVEKADRAEVPQKQAANQDERSDDCFGLQQKTNLPTQKAPDSKSVVVGMPALRGPAKDKQVFAILRLIDV